MDDIYDLSKFDIESYKMLIDSSRRDSTTEPEASEYSIDISANPFKNVVSVDLLAASVPRTGYIIDTGVNTFSYAMGSPPYATSNIVSVTLSGGDYNLSQLCDEINRAVAANAASGASVPVASPYTNPSEISNKIVFDSPVPFSIFLDRTSLGGRMGFGVKVTQDGVDAGYFSGTPAWQSQNFIDANVYVAVQTSNISATATFLGPMEFTDYISVGSGVALEQRFTALATGVPYYATLSVSDPGTGSTLEAQVLDSSNVVIAYGSVYANASGDVAVTLSTTSSTVGVTRDSVYTLKVTPSGGSCSFYINPQNLPDDAYNRLTLGGTVQSTEDALCATLAVETSGYRVISPGVVDLTGDRFLIVRCPEIETYTVRGERLAAETVHPGIGLLTLGTYGFTEAKLDFANAKPRTLQTPIAKLSKFTIRLESQSGLLYQTRGCDHSLLLCIRSAVPKVAKRDNRLDSMLSPGYHPDVWKYRREVESRVSPGQFADISSY
jgi:hypothetical protein